MDAIYRKQVELLIRCLPEVDKQTEFAFKGGTAINLFMRNMPRLSVDIDLVYLPILPRDITLKNIETSLATLTHNIQKNIVGSNVAPIQLKGQAAKLLVEHNGARIKIEPNVVQRGLVFDIQQHSLCEAAEDEFEVSATINTLCSEELYGSKLTAALDRQHPRDLFDVKLLLENEGITERTRQAFVVYLACHPRPMHELLKPNLKDIAPAFESQFQGMPFIPITIGELENTRETLIQKINHELNEQERRFLLSIKKDEADWTLLPMSDIKNLPAIQWKLQNIRKMDKAKHQLAINKLKEVLQL